MPVLYCICALLLLSAAPAAAQNTAVPAKTGYNVFLRGTSVGRENVSVTTGADGAMTIAVDGRLAPPINTTTRHGEIKYASDGSPVSFEFDGSVNGVDVSMRTTFSGGMATTEGMQGQNRIQVSHMVAPQSIVLPNGVMFGAFAAAARRLTTVTPPAELHVYMLPVADVPLRVNSLSSERMQTGTTTFNVRRYELTLELPPGGPQGSTPQAPLGITLVTTEDGSLLRMTIPTQGVDLLRDDVAASTSRTQIYSNPGDEAVIIPAAGFNIGATITHPRNHTGKVGAVILLAGSGAGDRDGVAAGVPILAQLAGAIADSGFLAVRYDKRGYGQSGGRAESATINDYAEDARLVAKWLSSRKDVDSKRIAIAGHSEGAMVALLAARDKRFAAVISLEGPALTGAELVLEQQQLALDQAKATPEERAEKVAMEKRILAAVATGEGWQDIPPQVRREADTPWFQSFVAYDPAEALDDVRQPILIVEGELDHQVPPAHAEKLAAIARKESKSKSVEVVVIPGVNHLLVPAKTGEVSEYASLPDRNVSKEVLTTVTGWLTRTLR